MKYFPDIEQESIVSFYETKFTFTTTVRIQYKGIWYDIFLKDSKTDTRIGEERHLLDKIKALKYFIEFMRKAYETSECFVFTDEMLIEKNEKGDLLFPPSYCQDTEAERLRKNKLKV